MYKRIYISAFILTILTLFFYALALAQQTTQLDKIQIRRGDEKLGEAPATPGDDKEKVKKPSKPWYARVTLSGEYNTNTIAKGKGDALPHTVDDETDLSVNPLFAAGYRLYRSPRTVVWTDVRYNSQYYFDTNSYDLQYIETALRSVFRLGDEWVAGLRTTYAHAWIGYQEFGDWIGLTPSLTFLQTNWANIKVSYFFRRAEYLYGLTNHALDKDGLRNAVQVVQNAKIPRTECSVSLGYSHGWDNTDGADYDKNEGAAFLNVWHPLFWGLRMREGFQYRFSDYDNINSRFITRPSRRRKDDRISLLTNISKKIASNLTAFVTYSYMYNFSDIDSFAYDRHLLSFGMNYEF